MNRDLAMEIVRTIARVFMVSAIAISLITRAAHSQAGVAAGHLDSVMEPIVLLFLVVVPAIIYLAATVIEHAGSRGVFGEFWHLIAVSAFGGGILMSHVALRPRPGWDWGEFFSGLILTGIVTCAVAFLSHLSGRLFLWVVRLLKRAT